MSARARLTTAKTTAARRATIAAVGALFAAGFAMVSAVAVAQESGAAKPAGQPEWLENLGRWFERQADNINSSFKDAGKGVQNFGYEAGVAAKTTVDGAKEAAGAVARIPAARVVEGHEKCRVAPNGAPDCLSAAMALCKAKGFESGKSADMTTAEVCPAQVYLAGRSSGPGCRTETFLSRALCQ